MPFVLAGDSAPWYDACLFIIKQLESKAVPNMATYHGVADDLSLFKQYLEAHDINYKKFPKRKLHRPTYRYRGHLEQLIQCEEIAASTARRRMSSVIRFYRWLLQDGLIVPEFPMWDEDEIFIRYTDNKGFSRTKSVLTTDVSVIVSKNSDPYAGTIDDGGKLRPLSIEEQEYLMTALSEIKNTRIKLMHLVSIFTGARIQTVLTLKIKHVMREGLLSDVLEVSIPAGPGTGIDTKGSKNAVLYIPRWLYDQLRIYAESDRAKLLQQRAGDCSDNQYLFLTDRGRPFYQSISDKTQSTKRPIYGQSVREYIRTYIIPRVRELTGDSNWRYKFHDLRATYGMNLTDSQMSLVQSGEKTLHQVREFVKTRMWHRSSSTTDIYLQFRGNLKMVRQVQLTYENFLTKLARKAIGGAY